MFRHGPSCLDGPVSHTLGRWSGNKTPAAESKPGNPGESAAKASDIRTELVERIRRAIAEGHYETPEKWEAALEALFQRLQDG